ncbi:MAG: transposase [Gammaproteobacteria bacterium]
MKRKNNTLLIDNIDKLRLAISTTKRSHPFTIHGWVVLPDHMHCMIELSENDCDFATRWCLIKMLFSRNILKNEYRNEARINRRERGIWQRRYWEHLIGDERDFRAHMDYVHINPVKHGLIEQVKDWPYSTFHYLVKKGIYSESWGRFRR